MSTAESQGLYALIPAEQRDGPNGRSPVASIQEQYGGAGMTRSQPVRRRRWWLGGVIALAAVTAAVPAAIIAHHVISHAVGRTTVATDADGTERTVYWRDYPGVAGVDPQEILQGPTPAEGYAAGRNMISEITTALSGEFGIEWVPEDEHPGSGIFHELVENSFGGQSVLTAVHSPGSQSTSVPQAWSDKQRVIRIIGDVSARYGYPPPRLRPTGGSFWQPNTITLSYGANGLLAAADRQQFKTRLEPFKGLHQGGLTLLPAILVRSDRHFGVLVARGQVGPQLVGEHVLGDPGR